MRLKRQHVALLQGVMRRLIVRVLIIQDSSVDGQAFMEMILKKYVILDAIRPHFVRIRNRERRILRLASAAIARV